MRKISPRQRIINECLNMIKTKLIKERGRTCEICYKHDCNLDLFHIIRRARSPRLILNTFNLLLTCRGCHYVWHRWGPTDWRNIRAVNRIRDLRGNDYMELLKQAEAIAPKMTMSYLKTYYEALKLET
jgi:5-methylcytosine-specific restriction endonuclease McrA